MNLPFVNGNPLWVYLKIFPFTPPVTSQKLRVPSWEQYQIQSPEGDQVTLLSQNWHLYSINHSVLVFTSEKEDLDSSSLSIPSIKADIIFHVPSKLAEAITFPLGLNSTDKMLDLCCLFNFSCTPPVVLFVIISEI